MNHSDPDPIRTMNAHDSSVLKLSISPQNDELILTAGMDGFVKLWDFRSSSCQGSIESKESFNSVSFHPIDSNLFATSDRLGELHLRDVRMLNKNSSFVLKYTTRLFKGFQCSKNLDIPSAVWNKDGTLLGCIFNSYYPTLYTMNDTEPLCVLQSNHGEQSEYQSISTIKTGSFSPDSNYFCAGSDDFSAYVWEIPSISHMKNKREMEYQGEFDEITFGFKRTKPFVIDQEAFTLKNHRSIVNSTLFHPYLPLIFTAGVEKLVRVFSPFKFVTDPGIFICFLLTLLTLLDRIASTEGRQRSNPSNLGSLFRMRNLDEEENVEENMDTLAFFDILQAVDAQEDSLWISDDSDTMSRMSMDSTSSSDVDDEFDNDLEQDDLQDNDLEQDEEVYLE